MTAQPARTFFGTDGVRGVANRDLTPELCVALGRALGAGIALGGHVVIGRDTRLSGTMLEAALASGIASVGRNVVCLGVLPTPAIAEAVVLHGAAAGAVISASHNPFADNGIKLIGPDGYKLADAQELDIEQRMADTDAHSPVVGAELGDITHTNDAAEIYIRSMIERFPTPLAGVSLVIDCANGATAVTAPQIFRALGARVTVMHATPTGVNINAQCGSTHPDSLQHAVREGGYDLGFAFDGDGDRMLAVDHTGAVVDGDHILAILALHMQRAGTLAGNAVVTTTMTNLGFRRAMAIRGIEVRWTDVGDRYVLAEMRAGGFVLGGEQSGHVINLLSGPTGDGVAAALMVLTALGESGEQLALAASVMERLPQQLVGIRTGRKNELAAAEDVWRQVRAFTSEFGEDGRVVVRASGTEPLVRVMVEAPSIDACEIWCARIAKAVEDALGDGSSSL